MTKLSDLKAGNIQGTNIQGQTKLAQLKAGVYQQPVKKTGLIPDVKSAFQSRQSAVDLAKTRQVSGQQTSFETGLQGVGQTAGFFGDLIGIGIGNTAKFIVNNVLKPEKKEEIKGLINKTLTNPIVQSGLKEAQKGITTYNNWKNKNPRVAGDVEAVINISTLLPVEKVAELGLKGIGNITKNIGTTIKEGQQLKKSGAVGEIIESYRSALNPLKSDLQKIEVKGGKDIDDTFKFLAEEKIVPIKDNANRLDTLSEADKLIDRKKNVDNLLASNLDNIQQRNDLNKIRTEVKQSISKTTANATELADKKRHIDELIDAEIQRYGRPIVTDLELHNIKNGMWTVGFDVNNRLKSPVAKKIGNTTKNIIQDNNKGKLNVGKLNELSGKYSDAISLLQTMHGNVIKGGKLGNWFDQLMGGLIFDRLLSKVPVLKYLAPWIGKEIFGNYKALLNDPERIILNALKKAKSANLGSRSLQIIKDAEEMIKNNPGILLLEAPKQGTPKVQLGTSGIIPIGPKLPSIAEQAEKQVFPTKFKSGELISKPGFKRFIGLPRREQ